MKYTFAPGQWENKGLTYAYSWRFPELPKFRQEDDCIVNSRSETDPNDFDYMGLLAPGWHADGACVTAQCSFEDLAAPMLLISCEEETGEDGALRTLEYYEVVIWRHGLNVWRHHTVDRKPSHYLVLGLTFPLAEGEIHTLSAEVREKNMLVRVDDREVRLFVHDLRGPFRLGYTACEGFCRLYEMTVTDPE